jgi:outer membrane cobalamin receptor
MIRTLRRGAIATAIAWAATLLVSPARAQETDTTDAGVPPDTRETADAGPVSEPAPAPTPAPTPAPAPAPALAPAPETITVRGRKLEDTLVRDLSKYGTRVVTISAADVQTTDALDVAGALEKLAPGLYITPKNGPFDYVDVSLQGSRTQDVLWLLDGVRLDNRLYASTTPLDTFPAAIVDRLEIIEGPQALFFGTQALAGAVNIVTKSFSDQTDGAISLGVNTLGGRHADAYLRTSIASHRFVVYGSGDLSVGYPPFRDQDYQPSSTSRSRRYELLTLGAKYGFDIRPDLRVSAQYQHTDARLDYARPYLVATAYNDRDEHVAIAKIEYSPSRAFELLAKGYYHLWMSHFTEFDNVPGSPGMITQVDNNDFWGFRDFGANAVVKVVPTRWFEAFAGYDFQSYDGNDAVLVIEKKSEAVHALFLQLRSPDWMAPKLAAGVRYNVSSFGPDATVWDVSARYDLGGVFSVRGVVGTAFRLPTAEELFANDPNDERGDPKLRPERSFGATLSIGGKASWVGLPHLGWDVTGFYRDVTDLISASGFDDATNQSIFENVAGTVRVRGVTAAVMGSVGDDWSLDASYTYSSAEQTDGMQIDRTPRHLAKGRIDWHPRELPIGAAVFASYVGDMFQSFGDSDREKIAGHVVVDLTARGFLDRERRHRVQAGVSNVLGEAYATSYGKATSDADGTKYTYWNLGAPRTFSVGYRYQF